MRLTIATLALLASTAVLADDLTIPSTFQPNTPARAADVNANFDAVETAVDDNAADIAANTTNIAANMMKIQENKDAIAATPTSSGIPVYPQGSEVGKLIAPDGSHFLLISPQGFVFRAHSTRPQIEYLEPHRAVFFSEPGCTGNAFIDSRALWQDIQGYVFAAQGSTASSEFYYSPRGDSPVIIGQLIQSVTGNNICSNWTDTRNVQEVFPNDPEITGVPNTAPSGQLFLGVP